MPSERFGFVLQQSDDTIMRLNLNTRFAVHTRFCRIMYGCRKHRAETIRYRIKILKFNATRRNLSFAFYIACPKSGFYLHR